MTTDWHFEARFRLPDGQRIHHDSRELVLANGPDQAMITLTADRAGTLKEAYRLVLHGLHYTREGRARAAGGEAVRCLLLSCLARNVGLQIEEAGPDVIDGVAVWTGNRGRCTIRGSAGAAVLTGVNGDVLAQQFAEDLGIAQFTTPDDADLLGLLADFHFDMNERSRLLLAMAVIELACTDPEMRNEKSAESRKCKPRIRKLLGQHSVDEYDRLLNTRHRVAHRPLMAKEIGQAANSAYSLACLLVRKCIIERAGAIGNTRN
jgi:hypothetical protein